MAATFYVRADANGRNDGSDWQNACRSLPASLGRGNVYYVADGTYGDYVFDDSTSGSQVIEIRKATQSDHGTDVRWDPSYGDGVAY